MDFRKRGFRGKRNRINQGIRETEVQVIDSEGKNLGTLGIERALEVAQSEDLDLVEVSANSSPPTCRIMDYGKYRFEQNKKRRRSQKNIKRIHVKEIKFRPATGEMDYQTKLRKLQEFIQNGDKIKIVLRFRGREMVHRDLGEKMLSRVREDMSAVAKVEQDLKFEGKILHMVMAPK